MAKEKEVKKVEEVTSEDVNPVENKLETVELLSEKDEHSVLIKNVFVDFKNGVAEVTSEIKEALKNAGIIK